MSYSSDKRIVEGYRFHVSDDIFRCTYNGCNKVFNSSIHINRHIRRHLGYECPACKKIFKFYRDKCIHMQNENCHTSKSLFGVILKHDFNPNKSSHKRLALRTEESTHRQTGSAFSNNWLLEKNTFHKPESDPIVYDKSSTVQENTNSVCSNNDTLNSTTTATSHPQPPNDSTGNRLVPVQGKDSPLPEVYVSSDRDHSPEEPVDHENISGRILFNRIKTKFIAMDTKHKEMTKQIKKLEEDILIHLTTINNLQTKLNTNHKHMECMEMQYKDLLNENINSTDMIRRLENRLHLYHQSMVLIKERVDGHLIG